MPQLNQEEERSPDNLAFQLFLQHLEKMGFEPTAALVHEQIKTAYGDVDRGAFIDVLLTRGVGGVPGPVPKRVRVLFRAPLQHRAKEPALAKSA